MVVFVAFSFLERCVEIPVGIDSREVMIKGRGFL